jgi:hypothetical protein
MALPVKEEVEIIVDDVKVKVDDRFLLSETMVWNFYDLLNTALSSLQSALGDISVKTADVTIVSPTTKPTFDEFKTRIPDMTAIENEILSIISEIQNIVSPTSPALLTVIPVTPEILPTMPSDKPVLATIIPPKEFNETTPIVQNMVKPTMPVDLNRILSEDPSKQQPIITAKTINPPPNLIPPDFTATLDISGIAFPYKSLNYTEVPYTSILKDRLQAYALDVLSNGGTGVNTAVEDAMFNRDIERANQANADAKNKAISEWAGRGAEMLDDDILDMVARIDIEFLMKRLEVSRDILIKAWELEQANVFKSLDISIGLETQLINLSNSVAQRALEALKTSCDIQIQICEVEYKRFNMKLEEFKTRFQIWETKYKAEMTKVEFYNAYLASMKLSVEIDQSKIDLFGKLIGIYQSRIDAAKTAIQAKVEEFEFEKVKLEVFKGDVQVFLAKAQLKSAEYQWMQAKIAGEESKVKLWATEIEGYKADLAGIEAKQNIGVENMKALLTYNDGLLKKQSGEVEVYKTQSEVGIQKSEVGIKGLAVESDVFKGIAMAYETLGGLVVKEYDANIQEAIAKAQLQLKNIEIEISNYEKLKTLLIGTLDSTTKVLAQGVAGALASVSAQAHMSIQGQAQEQYQYILKEGVT